MSDQPCNVCASPARYRLTAKAGRLPDGKTDYTMTLHACRDHFDDVYERLTDELEHLEPRIFVERIVPR